MKKATGLCFMIIGIIVLAGCAGTRSTQVQAPVRQLSLGHENMSAIRDRLGKPSRESTIVKNGQTLKVLSYVSGQASAQGVSGATLTQTQTFTFHEGTLVGQVHFSDQEPGRPGFDPGKVAEIKENKTQIEEAVNLLGRPSGEYLYPLIAGINDRAKVYVYEPSKTASLKGSLSRQNLVISFDTSGIVTKVELAENGEN